MGRSLGWVVRQDVGDPTHPIFSADPAGVSPS